ncbi:hypothetical protein HNP46_004362 [Pseudomonas nitritireducens]|uniref:Helix-turn-helix domain-containing protein n=1 Tax=Pseudomonas nitroreducens TaxID=46680 RepID=A0A7W7KNC1_PSENT|nr:hypothetical protein [Pseudomonas nitritireducens]MBB4865468.1 hypothetical protein [Pseudomonas nitritireducens]
MPDESGLAEILRGMHAQIVMLADGVQKLAVLLESNNQRGSVSPRILTEEQFAEFLGTTVAALRTRRFRKQIPEAIWVKEGRRTLYSVEAYEQWIQAQMQSSLDSVPSQLQIRRGKRLAKPASGRRPFSLLV